MGQSDLSIHRLRAKPAPQWYDCGAMEPQIQYAKTSDGVNIAYWTLGEGTPLVFMPAVPWSHVQLEWGIPELRNWFQRLAQGKMLVL